MGTNHGEKSSGNGANLTPSIPLNNKDEEDKLYVALWLACAGPNAHIPRVHDKVYYFPQGHAEQLQALWAHDGVRVDVPVYNLPSKILCKVVNIQLKAEASTDEVYAEITLLPYNKKGDSTFKDGEAVPFHRANNVFSFSKILTPSDTSTHGGFSVPKRHADECFPRLDLSLQPPVQELVAKDLNGFKWHFRHIYRGQPKRHLLTSGWSTFVSAKKLVPEDSCIFLRGEDGELRVGVRRATKKRMPGNATTSVIPENSMHHGIFASASHAIVTGCMFILYNRPWTGPADFVIPYDKYMESAEKEYLPGMRFGFGFESGESVEKRHIGTIVAVEDYDSTRWPNSKWRCLKVQWDGDSNSPSLPERLSPWEIKLIPGDRTDVFVQPLPKRGREIDLLLPGCPGMIKKGLLLNQRQKEVLQGQEISDACSDEPIAKIPCPGWKPKQLLQFPIYPSPTLLEATVCAGLSNLWSSASSTVGNSSNSVSQDCGEQSPADDETSHRQPSGCDNYMLFGFNLFGSHLELPSLNGEVLNSHSACPTSRSGASEFLLASDTPANVRGLVPEKQCKQCSTIGIRSCIKVLKYGTALGRSVNLTQFGGYKELISELDKMFEFDGSLVDESSGWKLTYIDDEGDLMLLGDYEWQAFRVAARKIFICPKEEINKLKPESLKSGIFLKR